MPVALTTLATASRNRWPSISARNNSASIASSIASTSPARPATTRTTSPFSGGMDATLLASSRRSPLIVSSCSLVNSRAMEAWRCPRISAISDRLRASRDGVSNQITVADISAISEKAFARALVLPGMKPANMKRSVGRPDTASPAMTALGPGVVVTAIPADRQAATSL